LGDSGFSQLNSGDDKWAEIGTLLKFDQTEFIDYDHWGTPGMRTNGWVYYPDTCITVDCKLVVFLHGGAGFGVDMLSGYYGLA